MGGKLIDFQRQEWFEKTPVAGQRYDWIYKEGSGYLWRPVEVPVEPSNRAPSYTNKQWEEYSNPKETLADAAKNQGKSVTEKFTNMDEWRSGITNDKGILQRVLQGAKK
jgi:hypothetical protein